MRGRRALVVAALGVVVLSGCATQRAGSAAIVGEERLTEAQLADWTEELDELYAANPDAQRPPDEQVSQLLVTWWLNEQLTSELAEQEDVSASATEVDELLGPDQEQREAASVQNAIPPSALEDAAEYVILRRSLAAALAPEAAPEEADAVYLDALRETAADLGVSVNPRFGTWNPDVPGLEPRATERLSRPVESAEPELSPPDPAGQ